MLVQPEPVNGDVSTSLMPDTTPLLLAETRACDGGVDARLSMMDGIGATFLHPFGVCESSQVTFVDLNCNCDYYQRARLYMLAIDLHIRAFFCIYASPSSADLLVNEQLAYHCTLEHHRRLWPAPTTTPFPCAFPHDGYSSMFCGR